MQKKIKDNVHVKLLLQTLCESLWYKKGCKLFHPTYKIVLDFNHMSYYKMTTMYND